MTREPVRPDPEYVVTSTAGILPTAFGAGTAQLCRGEVLPSGATVYRPESTGRLSDLCGQAEKLNAAARAAEAKALADAEAAELAAAVAAERDTDQPEPEGPHSRACGFAQHAHGVACSDNCPTCHGAELRDAS